MVFVNWFEVTQMSLENLVRGLIDFVPNLIGAFIVFVIGWFIAAIVGKFVARLLMSVKFNQIFERGDWKQALEKADLRVDPAGFIGAVFKWVLVIVFLLAAVDILQFDAFAIFIGDVLAYLPNVIIASLILVVTVIITDIVEKVIRAGVESTKVGYGHLVSVIVKWSIWIFAVLAILLQLQVAEELLVTVLNGFVTFAAIAGGIAFGWGGKDAAAEVIQDVRKKLKG